MVAMITTPRLMAVGGGALAELPSMLGRLGLAKPLIVTDPFLCEFRASRPGDRRAGPRRHPLEGVFRHGRRPDDGRHRDWRACLAHGDFDSLVAIGGGSSIDTAKG